jgi:alpha-N-arabinofuranosidase
MRYLELRHCFEIEVNINHQVINTGNSSLPLTVNLDRTYTTVNGTILTAPELYDSNTLNHSSIVVPKAVEASWREIQTTTKLIWDVPKWSITILQFNLK